MAKESPTKLVIDQFSYRGETGAIWRAFDAFLDTDDFLNLGYSRSGQTHLIGSPQARLVSFVADRLDEHGIGDGDRLLDIGCGRGGPMQRFERRLGTSCVGIDIVPFNLTRARKATNTDGRYSAVLRADASMVPVATNAVDAVVSIDAIVYMSALEAVYGELGRVLRDGGIAVVTDLLRTCDGAVDPSNLDRFQRAWGFPPLRDIDTYRAAIDAGGLTIEAHIDLTPYSVGRFRRWTQQYLRLRRLPVNPILTTFADRHDLDLEAIDTQVRAAHAALPDLRHQCLILRR